jgi:hypothetical protein
MAGRHLLFVGWFIWTLLGSESLTKAQDVQAEWLGVKVLERRPGIPLKVGKRVVGKMSDLGPTPLVIESQGDWLRVGTDAHSGWVRQHDVTPIDQAPEYFSRVIKADPKRGWAYNLRGIARQEQGDFDGALKDYSVAVRLNPRDAAAYNNRAWLLATCPDSAHRNSALALASARQACKLTNWKQPIFVDTLAAACAAEGDFKSAAKWQAIAMKQLARDEDFQREARERLEMYAAGSGYPSVETDAIAASDEPVVETARRAPSGNRPASRRRR